MPQVAPVLRFLHGGIGVGRAHDDVEAEEGHFRLTPSGFADHVKPVDDVLGCLEAYAAGDQTAVTEHVDGDHGGIRGIDVIQEPLRKRLRVSGRAV